ncbi:glycine cleavage system aminomethyltransferase GcvT [Parvularcula sp. LCG005]|uniref:glycine cleavage system aminomethyltransferase GcvT n=1 Tax=Parvularcula sp. LCG005 TaxID=3078805 RepID=UPI002942DD89|nr:glycine cleavage system aminomethyltransferase GcvT [Parvularcula sp. LCG005]WOI53690.1 glycine cleavage system aminomethyltransferase GcvT [Parvularcula sp. LCG005]
MSELKKLPLDALHRELGGKMVPFAGYEMPVQYPAGVKAEHLHTRARAGLFDVSHMGQGWLTSIHGTGTDTAHVMVADLIETRVPGEIRKLGRGRIRYTVLLSDEGGILDDLMITRPAADEDQGRLFIVVNAAVKDQDFALMREKLTDGELVVLEDRALLALQGPEAAAVLSEIIPEAADMPFMSMMDAHFDGLPIILSRCGYTGEDGFELSVPAEEAEGVARRLLEFDAVEPIGLGARDSLRLEAGLCLYGHDMSGAESPVEASIQFAMGKRRREEGGFPGYDRIARELAEGAHKVRVGIKPDGRAPAREGVPIQSTDGHPIGVVTSGGFGPTYDGPLAMGYVAATHAAPGTQIELLIRGKAQPATVVELPFVPQRYYRGKKSA